MAGVLRVGFVAGVTPDKWARSWRQRRDGTRLELVPIAEADAESPRKLRALFPRFIQLNG
jgi:hypothetical protein